MNNNKLYKLFRDLCYVIRHPGAVKRRFASKKLRQKKELTDEEYIKQMFRIRMGYNLDLENPKTFNEKLNWLKLFNRDPVYTTMVDKHSVKEFVASKIGRQYIAKEYGCYTSFDEIDFDSFPSQFVLKTTHGSGGIVICRDKDTFNLTKAREKLEPGLKENYYLQCREWPYKNVPARIIAEEYLTDGKHIALPVFKFFCFDGEPFIAQIIQNDKYYDETIDYIDMNYNLLKLKQNYPNSKKHLEKPECFEEMISVCRKLSSGIPFVRCDLYVVNGCVFFSEFTFFSDAGFEPFYPKKWDIILGDKIKLPLISKKERE